MNTFFHGAHHWKATLLTTAFPQRCCNPNELGEGHVPHSVLVKLSVFPHPTLHHQAERPLSKPAPRCWLRIRPRPSCEIIPMAMTHGHPVPNQSPPLQGSECPGDKQELLWHSLGQGDRPGTAVREGRAGSPPSHAAVKLGALRCLCRCPRNTECPSLHITRLGGEGLMPRTASRSARQLSAWGRL